MRYAFVPLNNALSLGQACVGDATARVTLAACGVLREGSWAVSRCSLDNRRQNRIGVACT